MTVAKRNTSPPPNERRRSVRYPADHPAKVRSRRGGPGFAARLIDLSDGGAALHLMHRSPLRVGDAVHLAVADAGTATIVGRGGLRPARVVRRVGDRGLALCFEAGAAVPRR